MQVHSAPKPGKLNPQGETDKLGRSEPGLLNSEINSLLPSEKRRTFILPAFAG